MHVMLTSPGHGNASRVLTNSYQSARALWQYSTSDDPSFLTTFYVSTVRPKIGPIQKKSESYAELVLGGFRLFIWWTGMRCFFGPSIFFIYFFKFFGACRLRTVSGFWHVLFVSLDLRLIGLCVKSVIKSNRYWNIVNTVFRSSLQQV